MKLKAILDTLDGVEEAVKGFYTEKDGKYVLQVDSLTEHPDAKAVKVALDKERTAKKDLQTKLDEMSDRYTGLPDDFTVDEYNRLKDGGSGNIDQRLADQRSRLETEFRKKEDKLTTENTDLKGKLNKLHSDAALNAAIAESGVAAPFTPAVRAMFKDKVKVDYEGDEAIVTIDNLPVSEHLKTWAGTEMGKHYVSAPANGGGGSGGGSGSPVNTKDNPWSKEGFNLTKQTELLKSDPAKAAQLKAAASATK